jgi:uridine phosphorylase
MTNSAPTSQSFIVRGGAGAVQPQLTRGHVIVPAAAVRDEGTHMTTPHLLDKSPLTHAARRHGQNVMNTEM